MVVFVLIIVGKSTYPYNQITTHAILECVLA